MLKQRFIKWLVAIWIGFFIPCAFASDAIPLDHSGYSDKTKLISQQIELLKNRESQFQNELDRLQREQAKAPVSNELPSSVNKALLSKAALDVSVAKSNRDSINVELAESQQSIILLDKDTQEIENQINMYSIFGLRVTQNDAPNLSVLKIELKSQKNLLDQERQRSLHLQNLQNSANSILQLNKAKYSRIAMLLKSQTMLQLKESQARSELTFQQQQSYWLGQLNTLYNQLRTYQQVTPAPTSQIAEIENRIFYANENVNFAYLQMLISRYTDQIHQFKISISHSTSITLLNNVSDQSQLLGKQLARVKELLNDRVDIVQRRKQVQLSENSLVPLNYDGLLDQYKKSIGRVDLGIQSLNAFRVSLDKALQHELSSRQGLPGFGAKAWLDLGAELLLVPSLTFQMLKSLAFNFSKTFNCMHYMGLISFVLAEILLASIFVLTSFLLRRLIAGVPDHASGHINLKWLLIKITDRNLIDLGIIVNIVLLFRFCNILPQNYIFVINLALVWLFFKTLLTAARLCLVETVHDREGRDVRLYHRLRWSFIIGGVITALTVFIHQLPLVYEVKDLFDRLFLLFLLVVSVFLLRSWEVIPGLILPHLDDKHTYVRRVVRLLGLILPIILLSNSAIGLFGYVNFIQTISWYESIFLVIMVGYLFVRGLLSDAMELFSQLLIRHVSNGWLWTEALLKPFDKILRFVLLITAGVVLFSVYGWDRQSPVVVHLVSLLNYHLVEMLDTSITLINLIELTFVISFVLWGAKWIREFVYRFLLSRTKDLGVRNSIAILSQYTWILIGVLVCLRVLGINFSALTMVAGAFAFGVGLGLRDLVNNFVCGFLLLLERPVRVGDTVTIGGYEGEVIHIGGRAVTVRTWDHMEVLVPNAEIYSKTFLNWTAKDHIVRTVINIKINRHDRPHDVQTIIYRVLASHKDVLRDPSPEVFLKELSDGMIEFEVRYFINLRLVKSRVGIRSEVLVAIWEAFENHGIKPPYPHHEIFVKGDTQLPMSFGLDKISL